MLPGSAMGVEDRKSKLNMILFEGVAEMSLLAVDYMKTCQMCGSLY